MAQRPLKIGIIGGTGLGEALGAEQGQLVEVDTPFGSPSSPVMVTQWAGTPIHVIQRHGPGHVFNPTSVPYRANIFAMKKLGVTHLLASGAVGSLREHIHPGELVVIDQVIDKTYRRANTFYEHAAVHIELSQPFCPVMRTWLLEAAKCLSQEAVREGDSRGDQGGGNQGGGSPASQATVHDKGTYVCMEGPAFSSVAESQMHRLWGGDLIGMTAMPEARLAREAEIAYATIAMSTDYDCWRPHDPSMGPQELIAEIKANLEGAIASNLALMKAALRDIEPLVNQPSPAHDALALGIWSDKSQLEPAAIERLRPLWGRYFDESANG